MSSSSVILCTTNEVGQQRSVEDMGILTFLLNLLSTSEVISSKVLNKCLDIDGLDKHDNHIVFLLQTFSTKSDRMKKNVHLCLDWLLAVYIYHFYPVWNTCSSYIFTNVGRRCRAWLFLKSLHIGSKLSVIHANFARGRKFHETRDGI